MKRILHLVIVILLPLGCTGQLDTPMAIQNYPFAYVVRDCAPFDGPAVRLYFSAEASDTLLAAGPNLQVTVWREIGEVANHAFRSADQPSIGGAIRCQSETTCEQADDWEIRLQRLEGDSLLPGNLRLHFPDGTTPAGSFRAAWRQRQVLCG